MRRRGGAPVKAHNGRDARCPLCRGYDGIWPPEFERILRRPVVAGMEMV